MSKLLFLLAILCANAACANTVTAKSWILADATGQTLLSENSDQQRSIGSITKLLTVITVIDAHQNPNELIGVYSRQQLIQMALVKSDNQASIALCDQYPGGHNACINAMNARAQSIGMNHSQFVEASGLSVMNVSTAEDLIKLVLVAKEYREVVQASQSPMLEIKTKKKHTVARNTNPLVWKDPDKFLVSKTGFINRAGGCIVMMLDTKIGQRIVVLLGSKNTHTRIHEAETILALK